MAKEKKYKEQEERPQILSEPIAEYYTAYAAESFADILPRDILEQAVCFAAKEHRAGKCIPHSEVNNLIRQRMGWK